MELSPSCLVNRESRRKDGIISFLREGAPWLLNIYSSAIYKYNSLEKAIVGSPGTDQRN
jgi:hypothetical protein